MAKNYIVAFTMSKTRSDRIYVISLNVSASDTLKVVVSKFQIFPNF